jgi:hypothetical protein
MQMKLREGLETDTLKARVATIERVLMGGMKRAKRAVRNPVRMRKSG